MNAMMPNTRHAPSPYQITFHTDADVMATACPPAHAVPIGLASSAPATRPMIQPGTVIMNVSSINCHPKRPLVTPEIIAMPISSRRPAIAAHSTSASSARPPTITATSRITRAEAAAESSGAMRFLYASSDGEEIVYFDVSSLAFFTRRTNLLYVAGLVSVKMMLRSGMPQPLASVVSNPSFAKLMYVVYTTFSRLSFAYFASEPYPAGASSVYS